MRALAAIFLAALLSTAAIQRDPTTTTLPERLASDTLPEVTTTIRLIAPPEQLVSPQVFAQWVKVAQCESGGNWRENDQPDYVGALGITRQNWIRFGGLRFSPARPKGPFLATPQEQVWVASRIQAGYPIPDQQGCGGGW